MKINLDIILIFALIGIVYRLFKLETTIYKTINKFEKTTNEKINNLERQLGSHLANYVDYENAVNNLLNYPKNDKSTNG